MRKTLYLKFVLAYILFGIFGFIVVATFVARMTMERCRREEAAGMYREAMALANTYAADLYNSEVSLDTVQDQITMLASYLDSKIWIVNPSGRLVVTSDERVPDPSSEEYIENFSPVFDESRNYVTGDFFGSFNEEYLSVLAPITSDFKIRGYVVVHTKTSRIAARANALLNISYLELLMLLLLSLICGRSRPVPNSTLPATGTTGRESTATTRWAIFPIRSITWPARSRAPKMIRKNSLPTFPMISVPR